MREITDCIEACMTPDDQPSLLSISSGPAPERGPDCPDEHQVAAYVDATLAADARAPFETHLADCGYCLALVGLLSRERSVDVVEPTAEAALARVRLLGQPARPRKRFVVPRWAAAAVVMLAVASLLRVSEPLGPTDEFATGSDRRQTRSASTTANDLQLFEPVAGSTVSPKHLTVRWMAVPGARYYDVRVVTETGDVVTEEQVNGTEWRPRDQVTLQPGTDYFVHVDAFVADDKAVSSEHVAFRVTD